MADLDFTLMQVVIMLAQGGMIGCLAVYLFRASRRRQCLELFDPCNEFESPGSAVNLPRPPRTLRRTTASLRRLVKRSEEVIDVVPLNAA